MFKETHKVVGGGVGLVWGRELNTATTDGFIFLIRKQTLLRSLSGHPEAGYSWVMTKPTFQNRMATMWAEHLEPAELEPSGQMFPSKFLVQFSPITKPTTKKKKKPTTWSCSLSPYRTVLVIYGPRSELLLLPPGGFPSSFTIYPSSIANFALLCLCTQPGLHTCMYSLKSMCYFQTNW